LDIQYGDRGLVHPETHTKRQATQHGCLPNLLGDGRHGKPNEPTKEGHLLFVLFESPFTSVSTVSRGLVSGTTESKLFCG
jgi:hypothetical protein